MFLLDRAALAGTRLQMISVGPSGPAFNDLADALIESGTIILYMIIMMLWSVF